MGGSGLVAMYVTGVFMTNLSFTSGSFSDAGTTSPYKRQAFLHL